MASSPPPVNYQAYKSKRHSRSLSNPLLTQSGTPPLMSRPPSAQRERSESTTSHTNGSSWSPAKRSESPAVPSANSAQSSRPLEVAPAMSTPSRGTATVIVHAPSPILGSATFQALNGHAETGVGGTEEPLAGPSSLSPVTTPAPRKSSTFRHVPLRTAAASRSSLPSSPLGPTGTHSRAQSMSPSTPRLFEQQPRPHSATSRQKPTHTDSRASSISSTVSNVSPAPVFQPLPSDISEAKQDPSRIGSLQTLTKSPSPIPTPPSISPAPSSSSTPTIGNTTSQPIIRPSAPYRPGFQPKGVYRPLTDSFVALRQVKTSANKIERTKLERRLEKLINLHFPSEPVSEKGRRPAIRERRTSSIFDLDLSDPSALWRGVLQGQATPGAHTDIRVAEQRITPWQNDADVSKCPLCLASFHPLTNRKHHCRLCGKIICSLPVKRPQRPATCSLLFVLDPKTRQIEEVGEGVDYGVRKQSTLNTKGKELSDNEKFLKGVRICRECRPILLREQYKQETQCVPTFMRLYEAFTILEKEIEDALPQFQELILTLHHEDRPTKEASNARKRLLEAFAQYDALSKRIRKLPCTAGPGSSQDRVQMAVMTRANLFLQKNMFPLQSLPKPKKHTGSSPSPVTPTQVIDANSDLARTLQPLLEQEALLESYVEEAKAHRKFEDAKTLKANLGEIRNEIERVLRSADGDPALTRTG